MNKFVIALALVAVVAFAEEIACSTKLINQVNANQKMWKAAHNPITRMPKSQARKLLGVKKFQSYQWRVKEFTEAELANAPDEFDSRTNWPNCPTIQEIYNQKQCGSCWAFGAVEAQSDRTCISLGKVVRLSPEDMTSCSRSSFTSCGDCEEGGQPGCAWSYWVKTGVVTTDCAWYTAGNDTSMSTPPCPNRCYNPDIDWDSDKHQGEKTYTLSGEDKMKAEISENGPIEVAFQVYEDFFSYSSGIYSHQYGGYEGGHAVKMIGYGEEGGVKYWTVANSWDVTWGEKGFFRIRRGNNECGIEGQAWAGVPKN